MQRAAMLLAIRLHATHALQGVQHVPNPLCPVHVSSPKHAWWRAGTRHSATRLPGPAPWVTSRGPFPSRSRISPAQQPYYYCCCRLKGAPTGWSACRLSSQITGAAIRAALWRHVAAAKGVTSRRTASSLLCRWLTWTTNIFLMILRTKLSTPTYKHQG